MARHGHDLVVLPPVPGHPAVETARAVAAVTWVGRLADLAAELSVDLPPRSTRHEAAARRIFADHGMAGLSRVAKLHMPLTERVTA